LKRPIFNHKKRKKMICGCCKDLGCFSYSQTIIFGVKSLGDNSPYIFHIWTNGTYQTISEIFDFDEPITLPFTFNENSETTIKIEIPSDYQDPEHGISFVSTLDGACCFTVHGLVSICH